MECQPAFNYARESHEVALDHNRITFRTPENSLTLSSTIPLLITPGGGSKVPFTLKRNEKQSFIIEITEHGEPRTPSDLEPFASAALTKTIHHWRKWSSKCTYKGRWREMVMRSALTLKMQIYEPTGAIVAAPTCSLPEAIGGVRNWDYRYTWIRDAAFTIFALLRLGYSREASRFIEWLQQRASETQDMGPLQVMYRIDGSATLEEFTLDHLEGYRKSSPVRVGNAATHQLQLDIYGELIDSIYLYNKHGDPITYDLWLYVRKLAYWVCDNWERPDNSIWEVRKSPQHYTYSKVQCWVALDRALRIATKRNLPMDIDRVRKVSQDIFDRVMEEGWNGESFVQILGGTELDATSLLFPILQFITPRDHRMTGTVEKIMEQLVSDSLVHRYLPSGSQADGLPGSEGTFSACSFWLVETLARSGKLTEARFIFEKMLTYANHLGLYAEEIGLSGQALGNFPQAFTHLGLITAAIALDDRLNDPIEH
jgi:GH15 family glucan-1,4-alpha-glucosidase